MSDMDTIERIAKNRYPPRPMSHAPIVGHRGPPIANSPNTIGMLHEMKKKMTVQDTTTVYTGVPPASNHLAPPVKRTEATAPLQIAAVGVRRVGETRASCVENGRPPSRANAYIMRDADVTVAKPHNS